MNTNINETLKERGSRYGNFDEHARITQNIKASMTDSPNWSSLRADMKECLEMVAHKIGRILNGDPMYHDSWHDINGYVKLVADTLIEKSDKEQYDVTRIPTESLPGTIVEVGSIIPAGEPVATAQRIVGREEPTVLYNESPKRRRWRDAPGR